MYRNDTDRIDGMCFHKSFLKSKKCFCSLKFGEKKLPFQPCSTATRRWSIVIPRLNCLRCFHAKSQWTFLKFHCGKWPRLIAKESPCKPKSRWCMARRFSSQRVLCIVESLIWFMSDEDRGGGVSIFRDYTGLVQFFLFHRQVLKCLFGLLSHSISYKPLKNKQ